MATPKKITVDAVEKPIDLSPQSISAIAEVAPKARVRPGRASDNAAAAKAASENVTVSTIETVTTPHAQSEETLTTKGQRKINLIWEYTQAAMTILIVLANVVAAFVPVTTGTSETTLTNAMFVVLGFYYGRTNHQKIGGVQQGR